MGGSDTSRGQTLQMPEHSRGRANVLVVLPVSKRKEVANRGLELLIRLWIVAYVYEAELE